MTENTEERATARHRQATGSLGSIADSEEEVSSRDDEGHLDALSVGGRISAFIKLIKPYRDLLALLVGTVVAVSAATAWITSYFATRAQVSHLECRTSDYIHAATKPLQSDIGRITAKWDRKEALRLMADPKQNSVASQLLVEADAIEAEQNKEDTESDKKFVDATSKCDRGPQIESALAK